MLRIFWPGIHENTISVGPPILCYQEQICGYFLRRSLQNGRPAPKKVHLYCVVSLRSRVKGG